MPIDENDLEPGDAGESQIGPRALRESLVGAVAQIGLAMERHGDHAGLSTGLSDLDRNLGGLIECDLLVLAGRPSMGTTALALNISHAVARTRQSARTGAPVAFFSLEASSEQLAERLLSMRTGIYGHKLRMGEIDDDEFHKIITASDSMAELPLYFDDTPALWIAEIRERSIRLKREHGLGLVVLDHLQATADWQGGIRRQRSQAVRGLKALAIELGVPVVVLSGLSGAVERRANKWPRLSDLPGTGAIEREADIVVLMFREIYYLELEEPSQRPNEGSEEFDARHSRWR